MGGPALACMDGGATGQVFYVVLIHTSLVILYQVISICVGWLIWVEGYQGMLIFSDGRWGVGGRCLLSGAPRYDCAEDRA